MISSELINANIISMFEQWRIEIKERNPYLLSDKFSNIFCTGVMDEWPQASMRVLIVGEEATWRSRSNYEYTEETELQECQSWIINDLKSQLSGSVKKRRSPFWRRIHAIHDAFPNAGICWTNIDCINTERRGKLSEKDRKALHDCRTKPVAQLVELIQPTHIVFCGWHNTSLQHEFEDLCPVVYPEAFGNTEYMKANKYIVDTKYHGQTVVFTYHPSWLRANSDAYIGRILQLLREK